MTAEEALKRTLHDLREQIRAAMEAGADAHEDFAIVLPHASILARSYGGEESVIDGVPVMLVPPVVAADFIAMAKRESSW